MSENTPANFEDDLFCAQQTQAEMLVSYGAVSPEDAEGLTVPLQERVDLTESGKFMALEEELARSPELTAELRKLDNDSFKQLLLDAGVISVGLSESGLLDRFADDDMVTRTVNDREVQTPVSGLKHIFLGDLIGGLHDYDSMEKSGLVGLATDTRPTKLQRRENGTSRANFITKQPIDIDRDGRIDEHIDHNLYTKTQFPEGWTADQVLLAICQVSELPETERAENKDGVFTVHVGETNGVTLRVVMNDEKIMVGYPVKAQIEEQVAA